MFLKLRELRHVLSVTKKQSVSMQRRLMAYFASMILVAFAALLLVLTVTGIVSSAQRGVEKGLAIQQSNAVTSVERRFESLTAQGITLSQSLSRILDTRFIQTGESLSALNDNPDALLEIQKAVFEPLYSFLQMSDCSGTYFILDATVNTAVPSAANSRSGVWLRLANVNIKGSVSADVTLFRGLPAIARENDLRMHDSWDLENCLDCIPRCSYLMGSRVEKLSEAWYWTERVSIPGTWEKAMFLEVPVVGFDGAVYGVCGFEISELHFRFSYPIVESEFGPLITVFAPRGNGLLWVAQGLSGGVNSYLTGDELLAVKSESHFQTYARSSSAFVGSEQHVKLSPAPLDQGGGWVVATLLPMESYRKYFNKNRMVLAIASVVFLGALLAISHFLCNRYVRPIANGLLALQAEDKADAAQTGISELDALYKFIQSKPESREMTRQDLPVGVEELFDRFIERAGTLTTSERNIFQYYMEGYEIAELPDLIFTSMSTVRKHNRSIYEKLEVSSRDELMLYIDLLRRCGRIQELYATTG